MIERMEAQRQEHIRREQEDRIMDSGIQLSDFPSGIEGSRLELPPTSPTILRSA
jgi:hypothetical protein